MPCAGDTSSPTTAEVSKPCCSGGGGDSGIRKESSSSSDSNLVRESVKNYYGQTLQTSDDLATNACSTAKAPSARIRESLKHLHPTTLAKYYGCGLCLPEYDLTGCHVLDLGCGAGRDVYLASQLVGPTGSVVGVDMTPEQLAAARDTQDYHAKQFGFANTQFVQGYLETLNELPELQQEFFDVIISNCVINLCTDKAAVLKACYDLLKPGGELYFSDVYASRRVPVELQKNEVLWGECLSGALYWNDFERLAKDAGFADPRLVEDAPITIGNKKIALLFRDAGYENLEFYSATYRLMKVPHLDREEQDYGQAVLYKGTIPDAASSWRLDKNTVFETGRVVLVGGNTWRMIQSNERLSKHFDLFGSFDRHFGRFVPGTPFGKTAAAQVDDAALEATSGGSGKCCS